MNTLTKTSLALLLCACAFSCTSKSFKNGYSKSRIKPYKNITFLEPMVSLTRHSFGPDSIISNYDDPIKSFYKKQSTRSTEPTESKYLSLDSLGISKDSIVRIINLALRDSLTRTPLLEQIKAKVAPSDKLFIVCLNGWYKDREVERASNLWAGLVMVLSLGMVVPHYPTGCSSLYSAMIDLNTFKVIYTEHLYLEKDLRDRETPRELADKSINRIYYEEPEN